MKQKDNNIAQQWRKYQETFETCLITDQYVTPTVSLIGISRLTNFVGFDISSMCTFSKISVLQGLRKVF